MKVRSSDQQDLTAIKKLYKKVCRVSGGLARNEAEINGLYIKRIFTNSSKLGIQLVIENPENPRNIIAEIHCYKSGLKVFDHVLSDLTVVVDPDFQHSGIGGLLFQTLLDKIKDELPDIFRVELLTRESNNKATRFYEKLGFVKEGLLKNRIKSPDGTLEADVAMAWFNNNYAPAL